MTERLTTIKSCTKCDHHLYTTVMHGDVEDLSPWIICAKEKRAFPLEGPAYSADPDKAEIPEWCPLEKGGAEDEGEEKSEEDKSPDAEIDPLEPREIFLAFGYGGCWQFYNDGSIIWHMKEIDRSIHFSKANINALLTGVDRLGRDRWTAGVGW